MDMFCSINGKLDEYHQTFLDSLQIKGSHFEEYKLKEEWRRIPKVRGNAYNIASSFYNNMKALEQVELYQREHGFVYDIVIKYRSDIVSDALMEVVSFDKNTLYVPKGFDYVETPVGAINDQIAYGDFNTMKMYSNVYEHMDEYLKKGISYHPETLLYYHLKMNDYQDKIQRFPFNYRLNPRRKI